MVITFLGLPAQFPRNDQLLAAINPSLGQAEEFIALVRDFLKDEEDE